MKQKFIMVVEQDDLLKMIGTSNNETPTIENVYGSSLNDENKWQVEVTFSLAPKSITDATATNKA